jgi:hypothetical protein
LYSINFFDEDLRAAEDWDLNLRLSKYYEFKFIDEALIMSYQMMIIFMKSITNFRLYGKNF